MNEILSYESKYLDMIMEKLKESLTELNATVSKYEDEFKKSMKYLWENRSGMDKMEIFSNEKSVSQIVNSGELTMKRRTTIEKLIDSPYFARVDFIHKNEEESEPFYIGRFSYVDKRGNMLIYDWRAPISSLYYDFELGHAFYEAPVGLIEGEMTLKRQYKIKNSLMEYALESSISINDEVLQKELSHTSDQKMKNIVATIQKEQNQIIRNEDADVLVIQGVAGSGKTSIALHRVAYFLYKYKERLSAQNIMIISPNKVFADYISNVLPELGEEPVTESSYEDIAFELLNHSIDFESFAEQVETTLEENDKNLAERIKFKSSLEFLSLLDQYLDYTDEKCFCPCDCIFGKFTVQKGFVKTRYHALRSKPVLQRMEEIAENIIERMKLEGGSGQKIPGRKEVQKKLAAMLKFTSILEFYTGFFEFIGRPDLFTMKSGNKLEASDVYPYLYLKIYFEGIEEYDGIKHAVIDEMQDYTPVQYAVIKKLFRCRKTILGDFGQSVNPYNSISKLSFMELYENTKFVELTKSYRSTFEIIKFAQKIQNHNIDPVERHGDEPQIKKCRDRLSELAEIYSILEEFERSAYSSIGIICRTNSQAEELYKELSQKHEISLLDFGSTKFSNGITITAIHMAKGLEFDEVVIPFVNSDIYHSEYDRSLLYIACTRAMHKLTITSHGQISRLLTGC
ncbi:MAG: AAA family ATPase [Clostridia bacterium]|nr:AAA family ATPase [Clostridia bacterium]